MKPGDRDELLSAYLDREVTPDERAQVEARLDASPDTRAELDALAELSLCLRTLDRPSAPPELKSSIMQALAGRSVPPVAVKVAKPRRSYRREWIVSIAAMATTACGLFLAVTNLNSSRFSYGLAPMAGTRSQPAGALDGVAYSTPAPAEDYRRVSETELVERRFGTLPMNDEAAPLPRAESKAGNDLRSLPAAPKSAPPPAAAFHLAGEPVTYADREAKEKAPQGLEKVALNQLLEMWAATDAPDRYVANIDMQVLDVKRVAGDFQVLLLNNGVVTLPADDTVRAKKSGEAPSPTAAAVEALVAPSKSSTDQSMVAVYVDTTTDRVTKSLEELAQRHDILSVRLPPPLALARLAEESGLALEKERTESLQRADLVDVTNAIRAQQWMDLDAPADALDALSLTDRNELADRPASVKQQVSNLASRARAAGIKTEGLKDAAEPAASVPVNSLNYVSEVKLPLLNSFETLPNGTVNKTPVTNNGTALTGQSAPRFNEAPLVRNALNRNAAPNDYGNNYGARQRAYSNREPAGAVRVLVVFQDAPPELKAKANTKAAP